MMLVLMRITFYGHVSVAVLWMWCRGSDYLLSSQLLA